MVWRAMETAPSPSEVSCRLSGTRIRVNSTAALLNIGIPAVAITTGLSPSYVEIMPMLTLPTGVVVVTCAPSVGTFGSSATTCTGQTTAGATGR